MKKMKKMKMILSLALVLAMLLNIALPTVSIFAEEGGGETPKDITQYVDRSKPDVYRVDNEGNKTYLIRQGQVVKYKNGKESEDADAVPLTNGGNTKIEFEYTWHITEENMKLVKPNDFFTLQLPKAEFLTSFSFEFDTPIKIDSEDGHADGLGTFTISRDGVLKATLNQNVENTLLVKNGKFDARYSVLENKIIKIDVDVPQDATAEAIAVHGEDAPVSNATLGNNEYKSLGVLAKDGEYAVIRDKNTQAVTYRGIKWYLRAGHDQYKLLTEALAAGEDPATVDGLVARKNVWLYDDIQDPDMVIDRSKGFEIRPYAYLMTKEGKLSTYAFSTPLRYLPESAIKVPNAGETYEDFKTRMQSELQVLKEVAIYPATDGKGERIIVNYGNLDINQPNDYFSSFNSNIALVNALDNMLKENKITSVQHDYNIKAYKLEKTLAFKRDLESQLALGQITQEEFNAKLKKGIENDSEGNRSIPNLYYTVVFYTKSNVPKATYINQAKLEWNNTQSTVSNPKKVVYSEAGGSAGLEDTTSFSVKKFWQGKAAVDEITAVLTGDDTEDGKAPTKYEIKLKKADGWIGTFLRVKQNKEITENGIKKIVPIKYTVSEKETLANYEVEAKKDYENYDFALVNRNKEKIKLTIIKKWKNNVFPAGSDGTVTVSVYDSRDTKLEYPLAENVEVPFDSVAGKGEVDLLLPKYHMGNQFDPDVRVNYVVREALTEHMIEPNMGYHYGSDVTPDQTATIFNAVNIRITIKKVWVTPSGKVNPEAEIYVMKNGVKERTFITNVDKEVTYYLPKFDGEGNVNDYTVVEKELPGYNSHKTEVMEDGIHKHVFTNREFHNLKVTKKWKGTDVAQQDVKLTLYYKNSESESFTKEFIDVNTGITAVYNNQSGEASAPLDNSDGKVKFTLPADTVDGVLTIKGLSYVDKDGKTLFYTVREDEMPGFLPCVTCNDSDHQVKTLYNLASKSLTLKKTWAVSDDTQKTDVEFVLSNDGNPFEYNVAQTIKKANANVVLEVNKVKVTIPKATGEVKLTVPTHGLDGNVIAYKAEENQLSGFYEPVYDYTQADVISVKNISNETVSVKVKKVWRHPAGTTEKNVTIALRPAQSPEKAVMLPKVGATGEAKWEHDFTDLPKFDKATGDLIDYTVEEIGKPQDYNVTYGKEGERFEVINTINGKIAISVTKKWLGEIKANQVTVGVFQSGASNPLRTAVLEAKASDADPKVWTDNTSFADLPQYDGAGQPYSYEVKELFIGDTPVVAGETADYKVTIKTMGNSVEITNYNREKIEVPFIKTWVGKPAEQVSFRLKEDGNATAYSITLTATDAVPATETDEFAGKVSWAGKFGNLPKYSETDGHEIVYTVEEDIIAGYRSEQEGNTFTNTNIEKIDVSVTKRWVNSSVDKVQIDLLADGKKVDGITLKDPWNHTFTGLFKYDQTTGKEIVYTVVEKEVPNFKTEITGDVASGFIVTNTYIPPLDPYYPPGGETPDKPTPPETPTPDKPTPDKPTPDKPTPTPSTEDVPNEPTPQGDPNKPTPSVPPVPSVPEEEVPTESIPEGKTELPKTDGIPAGAMHVFGLAMAAIGLLLKKKK